VFFSLDRLFIPGMRSGGFFINNTHRISSYACPGILQINSLRLTTLCQQDCETRIGAVTLYKKPGFAGWAFGQHANRRLGNIRPGGTVKSILRPATGKPAGFGQYLSNPSAAL
jgi:hypothetical protein